MTAWAPVLYDIQPFAKPQALRDVHPLLSRVVEAFGAAATARLMGVDPAMVTRWRKGKQLSTEMSRRIIDLHDIFTRALQVMVPAMAMSWLMGSNPHLAGARPIDVLAIRGIAPVIDALQAFEDLGYA